MLADFMRERELKPGRAHPVLRAGVRPLHRCLHDVRSRSARATRAAVHGRLPTRRQLPPPHDPAVRKTPQLRTLLGELASIWHDYRSRAMAHADDPQDHDRPVHACGLRALDGGLDSAGARRQPVDARRREQPRRTPTRALAELDRRRTPARSSSTIAILFEDYRRAGGDAPSIDALRRNPGGEALNAYMHALARQPNPLGLLGAIYIIEGTGQRIIPALLPLLRRQLDMPGAGVSLSHVSRRERCEPPRALADCAWRSRLASTPPAQRADRRRRALDGRAVPAADGARAYERVPKFLSEPHDARDPSPWLALYLDQSIPIAEDCKRAWLADSSSRSRQFLLPMVRPLARATIVLFQLLKIVDAESASRHRACCIGCSNGTCAPGCRATRIC